MTNGSGSYLNYTSGYKTFYFALKITMLSVWNLNEQQVKNLNRTTLKYKQCRQVYSFLSPFFSFFFFEHGQEVEDCYAISLCLETW